MSTAKEVHSYTAQRVVLTSAKPFPEALAALNAEVNAGGQPHVSDVLRGARNREQIERGMAQLTADGKRDFVLFSVMAHSEWLGVYTGEALPQFLLYTFGNPLIAKEFLLRDPVVGACVPPRVFLRETVNGGTSVEYDLPSAWYVERPTPELKRALEGLDEKLEALVRKVLA